MKKSFFSLLLTAATFLVFSQQNLNVLFIGNSYTGVNNLPQLVQQVTESAGDELTYNSNTPGGCTFSGHCNNNSINMIEEGGWDYVILQGQSQETAFPNSQVAAETFPFAQQLCEAVYDNCATPVFYMSWGYKYGDTQNGEVFPPIGTYEGMDSLIHLRYMTMAENNDAMVSPVGRVWKYIRENHPEIELYSSDNSHPSYAGSYAAACTFYTTLFRNDPTNISFNGSLSEELANTIKNATKTVVFDDMENWFIGEYDPFLTFNYTCNTAANGISVSFFNSSYTYWDAASIFWDFGDGNFSTENTPIHTYSEAGSYTVTFEITDVCGKKYNGSKEIEVASSGSSVEDFNIESIVVYPNPTHDHVSIRLPNKMYDKKCDFVVYNYSGAIIQSGHISHSTFSINLSDEPSGIFFIRILENHNLIKTLKIIKQ